MLSNRVTVGPHASIQIGGWRQVGSCCGWLRFFVAALGVGLGSAQEQTLLNYWWVYADEQPEPAEVSAVRVIRVTGEKGEAFESVYADESEQHPAVIRARRNRDAMLRQEAIQLAAQLKSEGVAPQMAYEQAWTEVFRRNWLTADWHRGSSRLADLLADLATQQKARDLTDEEVQLVLEALLEDDDRLEGQQGRELIQALLVSLPSGAQESAPRGENDELMALFADAMQYGYDSMAAYRDALFKVKRGSVVRHSLVGYRAPLGTGIGGRAVYRQAPQQVGSTAGSAGSPVAPGAVAVVLPQQAPITLAQPQQVPALSPDFTAGMNLNSGHVENFLATAPEGSDAEPTDEEKKKITDEDENDEHTAPIVLPAPAPRMMMMPRSYAAHSVGGVMLAAAPELTWSGSATSTWVTDNPADSSPWVNSAIFSGGSGVRFDNSGSVRDVTISGQVAPGAVITVDSDSLTGKSGSGSSQLQYAYAFTGSGGIADYTDAGGNVHRSSIHVLAGSGINERPETNSAGLGGSVALVLDTANTFSGGITLDSGTSLYLGCEQAAGTGTITMADDSVLIVNYRTDDVAFRTPTVNNALVVSGNTEITSGLAAYGENRITSDWRTLTLSGGISGDGQLTLYGYSYMIKPTEYANRTYTYNYVSSFSINERQVAGSPDRFTGTVSLKNEFTYRDDDTDEVYASAKKPKHLGGALQLTLVDDVFSEATLNLTRDFSDSRSVGHNEGGTGKAGYGMTSDNILVLSENSQIRLKALEADFLGKTMKYNFQEQGNNKFKLITSYDPTYAQQDERWLARVVTDGYTNLVLEDDSAAKHVFSGAMGFAQSYTTSSQASILAPTENSKYPDETLLDQSRPGGGSLGLEALSLEKRGAASQYIHSAKLQNLTVVDGVAGFNHLSLTGNLAMVSGAELQLATATIRETGWDSISGEIYNSTDTLSVGSGNRMLVVTQQGDLQAPAKVTGSLTLETGSSLAFDIRSLSPSPDTTYPHLDVSGTLTLQHNTPVSVSLASTNFVQTSDQNKYYLAGGSTLSVQGGEFTRQLIPLGYGYYGTVYVEGNYLVLSVDGDPRRTWSGMRPGAKPYSWFRTDYTEEQKTTQQISTAVDNRWKENCVYQNGQVVLFGNLYEPVGWSANVLMTSNQTVVVDGARLHAGTLVGETTEAASRDFAIDGVSVESLGMGENADRAKGYQAVMIEGDVAPMSVVINSAYTKEMGGSSKLVEDATHYYLFGSGGIADAAGWELDMCDFDTNWKTNLRKTGLGTAVIATHNTYSGGTVIEGGRLVMQDIHALGTGEITMLNPSEDGANIPILQGDFADTDKSGAAWAERIGSENVPAYTGEGMETTTIHNTVNVTLQSDSQSGLDMKRVDARVANAHDKKLVLRELNGNLGTVLTLYGSSAAEDTYEKYTYAVFKVLDPSDFYGTIRMDGNLWNAAEGSAGGNVQMEIMTTTKSANGADWLNATIDLSVENGTNRTVLALDALGTAADAEQTAQVDSLNGGGNGGARINSSVLSMSRDKSVTLELEGMRGGEYDGVLGFGDFQETLAYPGSADVAIGAVEHHYGGKDTEGELNVLKLGHSTQSVNSAWLNRISVGRNSAADGASAAVEPGGTFVVDEALVVSDLQIADGSHVVVGNFAQEATYGLTVGAGGILAFDKVSGDAFTNIGAGIPKRTQEKIEGDNVYVIEVAPENFVLLTDGATISASGDWLTNHSRDYIVNGRAETLSVGIDIQAHSTVTFNTHHYTVDGAISESADVFGCYNQSHVIQLLGEMKGRDVHLIFNNELISQAAQDARTASRRADGLGYVGQTGTEMGHVVIRDIHQFTGDIAVKNMTVLQVMQTNSLATASTADMEVTVSGANAAIQFVDAVKDQYISNLRLDQGGHLFLGGAQQTARTGWSALDLTEVELDITNRQTSTPGSISNLDLVKESSAIKLGGTDSVRSEAADVRIETRATSENYNSLVVHDTNLHGSLVKLHEECSFNLADAVLVDAESKVQGTVVMSPEQCVNLNPLNTPATAAGGNVGTTSVNTTVQLTFADAGTVHSVGKSGTTILVVQADQLQGVNVGGDGLTIQFCEPVLQWGYNAGAEYVAIQVGGRQWPVPVRRAARQEVRQLPG